MVRDHSIDKGSVPLLDAENPFKLAVFGMNNSCGNAMTSAEGRIEADWEEQTRIALAADRAGLDALIPVARWKGYGGDVNFNDRSFETLTWAAGLGAITERIMVVATTHVPISHPIALAKQGATVDHISGGRFGLNIVAGWNEREFAMFGVEQRAHDDRYDVAEEWLELTRRLWTEDTFDFEGRYYVSPAAHSRPLPVQRPYPVVMSAGASPRGLRFAAGCADINFITGPDLAGHTEKAAAAHRMAREEFGREIAVMGMGAVVCADTEREARAYFDHYVYEKGDWSGVANIIGAIGTNIESMDFQTRQTAISLIAGSLAEQLVGTPEQIVDQLLALSHAGLDGLTLSWVDYESGVAQYQEQLLPLLVEAGLRAALPVEEAV